MISHDIMGVVPFFFNSQTYFDSSVEFALFSCLKLFLCWFHLSLKVFDGWNQHKNSFKHENKANSTELSKYVWELKKKGTTPIISWEIIDHARPYNNGSKVCHLCSTEKFHIITSKRNLLNKRTELVSTCRHVNKFLLKNIKVSPPDPT